MRNRLLLPGAFRSRSSRRIASAAAIVAASLVGSGRARAYDVSPPAILQDFESTWQSVTNKMPDVFAAGYGGVYTPPPSRAESGNQSVGYDVYDRFDLGSAGNPTLYGTGNGLKQMISSIHAMGGNSYIDMVWNHDGFADAGTSGFAAAGGYPGFALTLQTSNSSSPGYNTRGYNAVDGDFHSAYATGDQDERLAGLVDIDQGTNFQFIRNPTVAGNPLNIPGPVAGAAAADNHPLANVPTASNAQFYPSQSTTPQSLYDPTLGQTFTRYQFDNAAPLNGTPVAENDLGYLQRFAQYLIQVDGADGFRMDAAKNMPTYVFNYLDLATYDASNRFLLNGQRESVFSWSEVFDSSPSLLQSYINKSATGTDTGNSGTVGGNRDVYDFPLFFAMQANLTGTTANNDWTKVVGTSIDANDDGLLNGSQGVKFVQSQDNGAPALSSVAYAYTLMQPGNALVYFNGHNFGTESQRSFPQDGREDALGGVYGSALTTLVDLRNRFGQGNYRTDLLSTNQLAFERQGSSLTLLSNVTEGGFDSRTVDVTFAAGTPLLEYTGNAASTNAADGGAQIPQLLVVNADSSSPTGASVNVRFLRNSTYVNGTSTFLGNGYLIYGLPTPTGTLKLTNVASTFGGSAASASDANVAYENGTQTNSTVDVVRSSTFQVQLSTNIANLLGSYRDHDSDGDNAILKVDGGVDVSGSGLVTDPANVAYGFGQFVTVHSDGYDANGGAGGNGSYAQTINVAQLGQGYHYITVDAFRHRTDGGPPVYTDWKQTIYVDTAPPNSTVTGFDAAVAGTNENRNLNVTSVDGLANSVSTFLDLPFGLTDAQVLAMVGSASQANQLDVASYQHYYSGVTNGNHSVTVVSYKPDGTYNIQRFASNANPYLSTSTAYGAGIGDLNADGSVDTTDIAQFQTVLQSTNTQFNAAADVNGDGLVDLADTFLLGPVLTGRSVSTATYTAYNGVVNSAYVKAGSYSVVGTNVIYDDTAASTTVTAGSALTASWVRGGSLALATGSTVHIASGSSVYPAGTSGLTALTLTGSAGAWTSRLDVGTQQVIVASTAANTAADLARFTSMAAQAYDGGKLDRQGIGTSTVDGYHAVAVIPNVNPTTGNAFYTNYGGQTLDANSILIGYAAYGDTDLGGSYNAADLTRMNGGFINHTAGWVNGDFNYDGVVDGRDYALVQNPIRQTTTWTGGSGTTSNWSDGKNWSTGTPPPYDTIVFTATTRTTVNNDLTAANQHLVQFNSTAPYTITGNGLTLYDYAGQQSKIENQGTAAATVDLPVTFGALTGQNVAEINAVNGDLTFTANGTVALTGAAVASLQLYGNGHSVTFNGVISGAGRSLQLNGSDAVYLDAANTYSGGTNVYAGTVRANAAGATGAGPVNVNSAGTLGGSGSVTGTVNVNTGGAVAPGSTATTIGVLTTGPEVWNGGGTLVDKVVAGTAVTGKAGTSEDELVMSSLSLVTSAASPFTVDLSSLGTTTLATNAVLPLATTASGTFDLAQLKLSLTNVQPPSGYSIVLADAPASGGDTLYADVVAAPEPTSLGLLAVAGGGLLTRRRRRA